MLHRVTAFRHYEPTMLENVVQQTVRTFLPDLNLVVGIFGVDEVGCE